MNRMKGMAGASNASQHSGAAGSSGHAGQANMGDMGDMGDMEGDVGMGMPMQMYFHTGFTEYILFEKLQTKSTGGLAAACVVIFLMSIGYEGIKFLREMVVARNNFRIAQVMVHGTPAEKLAQLEASNRMLSSAHFLQTGLHAVQVFVSYILMLVFMTYNAYLCLSVILGATLGYFLVGWRRTQVVDNEHCH